MGVRQSRYCSMWAQLSSGMSLCKTGRVSFFYRRDGGAQYLLAPAWITRIEACRQSSPRNRERIVAIIRQANRSVPLFPGPLRFRRR